MTVYGLEEELQSTDEAEELRLLRVFYQIIVGCDAQNELLESLSNEWDKQQDQDTLQTWAELSNTCDLLRELYK